MPQGTPTVTDLEEIEMRNKAALYLRVSTREQSDHGVSLEAQEERLRAYCTVQGLEVVAVYREVSSAGVPLGGRAQGAEMLKAIKGKEVEHVVALKLDRLFRSTVDALNQTTEWDKKDIAMHLVDMGGQTIDTSTAIGRLFLTMAAGFAEMERALIAERTVTAMQHKKRQRKVYTNTPYGFDEENGRLVTNREEQAVIGEMVAMRESGGSYRKIADHLNEKGIQTKRNAKWHGKSVMYILKNVSLHEYSLTNTVN